MLLQSNGADECPTLRAGVQPQPEQLFFALEPQLKQFFWAAESQPEQASILLGWGLYPHPPHVEVVSLLLRNEKV